MLSKKELREWIADSLRAVECGAPSWEFIYKLDEVMGKEGKVYHPGDIITASHRGPHGRAVVAVIGYDDDFAAYEQSNQFQTTSMAIATSGDKLIEEQARPLFPDIQLHYRE